MESMGEFTPPKQPEFDPELLERCRQTSNYSAIAFEWYKHVGLLAFQYASAIRESPAFRSVPAVHFATLTGSLNRCCRLMLANLRLSNEGKHGEASGIIDRCIVETCTKIIWLCQGKSSERFERFLADGLKRDLELRDLIRDEIRKREGKVELVIEKRMMASIERAVMTSMLDEQMVKDSKKIPDMATLLQLTGHERLAYVATERMGSHAVHGSWTDLLTNYLELEGERFVLRDNDIRMEVNQFVGVSMFVLDALEAFVSFMCEDRSAAEAFAEPIRGARREVLNFFGSAVGDDFEPA